jgi:hypothetical protein
LPPGGRAPRAGGAFGVVGVLDWVVGVLDVVGVVVDDEDEAALAIAAPPPATAAVTATVVSTDLIRICDSPPLRALDRTGGCAPSV